jgi:allantoin racemase
MSATIHVVNPNSLESVTRAMDEALEPLRLAQGPRIECHTLADGPPGIQSQQDVETAIPPLMREVGSLDANADDTYALAHRQRGEDCGFAQR